LSGVADVETAAEAGLVTFALDAVATGAITAASASFARQDLIYIQIDIPVEDGSAVPVVTRKYIAGTVASTDPALPVSRAFAIARINVPISGGGSPTVTWIAPYAVAAGGVLPVATLAQLNATPGWLEARAAVYGDSTAANNGDYRWNGSAWVFLLPRGSVVHAATFNNLVIGNSTVSATYDRVGDVVHCQGSINLGSTSALGTAPQLILPFPGIAKYGVAGSNYIVGQTGLLSRGVTFVPGSAFTQASTAFVQLALANGAAISPTSPFTWKSTDELSWNFTYQAA